MRFILCEYALTFIQIGKIDSNIDTSFLMYFLIKQVSISDEEIYDRVELFLISEEC